MRTSVNPMSRSARRPGLLSALLALTIVPIGADAASINWRGDATNAWNVSTTTNWVLASDGLTPAVYANGDEVRFDDSALANFTVRVAQAVSPTAVTVSNSLHNYLFTGTTAATVIGGTGTLVKAGSGTLTLSPTGGPHLYKGGTVVDAGTLVLTYANGGINIGTIGGPLTISSGATVRTTTTKAIGLANFSTTGNVTSITINGGLLDYTGNNGGLGGGQTVIMTGGEIRSNGGVSSPTAAGYYRFQFSGSDPTLYTKASTDSAVLSGRVQLDQPSGSTFDVEDGGAVTDLLVSASITGTVATNGIIKAGAGLLALTGTNTYVGPTVIRAGTLQLGEIARLSGTPTILVSTGSVFDVHLVSGGFTMGSGQTLAGDGTVTGAVSAAAGARIAPGEGAGTLTIAGDLTLDVGATSVFTLAGGTNDVLLVSGTLTAGGSRILVEPSGITNGTYTIIRAGNPIVGGFNPAVLNASPTETKALSLELAGNEVQMRVSDIRSVRWDGRTNGVWDVAVASNWIETASSTTGVFYNGDMTLFDDTEGVARDITLSEPVLPTVVTVVNSTNDFTWLGAGRISGMARIEKSGTAMLIASNANDFTGSVTVAGGMFKAGNATALGAVNNSVVVTNGATLDFAGYNTANRGYGFTLAGAGVSNAGAVVNSGVGRNFGAQSLTLAADAAIGGTGRWDVRPVVAPQSLVDLGNHTLTKTGANYIALVDGVITNGGTIEVAQGTLTFTRMTANTPGTVNVEEGATLQFENNTGGQYGRSIALSNSTLRVVGNSPVVSSPLTLAGTGTVDVAAGLFLTLTNIVSGTGALVKTTAGTLVLGGENTYAGGATLNGGTLSVSSDANLGLAGVASSLNAGTLQVTGTTYSTLRAFTLGTGGVTLEVVSSNLTVNIDQPFGSGAGAFTKAGAGRLALQASASMGSATVAAGTLAVTNGGGIAVSGNVVVGSATPGTLRVHSGTVVATNFLQTGSAAGHLGAIRISGGDVTAGIQLLIGGGGNTANYGFLDLSGGTLTETAVSGAPRVRVGQYSSVGLWYQSGGVFNGSVGGTTPFDIASAAGTNTGLVDLTGPAQVNQNAGLNVATVSAATGVLNVAESASAGFNGTITVGAASNSVGVVNLNGGTLRAAGVVVNAGGTLNLNGGTLQAGGASTALGGAGAICIYSGGAVLDTQGNTLSVNMSLSVATNSGVVSIPVTAGGTGYIGAPFVWVDGDGTGATAVAVMESDGSGSERYRIASLRVTCPGQGYSQITNVTLVGGGGTGAVINAAGAVFAPNAAGSLTKTGAGFLTLTTSNRLTGATVVSNGTLSVTGPGGLGRSRSIAVESGATLSLSTGAAIDDDAVLTLRGTGKINLSAGVVETVGELFFDATSQTSGRWGATGSGASLVDDIHFSGTGVLLVRRGSATGWTGGALIVR